MTAEPPTPLHAALAGEPARAGSRVAFFEPAIESGYRNWVVRAVRGSTLAVVWWEALGNRRGGIYRGRLFSLSGKPLSGAFRVSGELTTCDGVPGVDLLPGGELVVAWACTLPRGTERDASERVLLVRGFGADGAASGEAVPIELAEDGVDDPEVFAFGPGRALVTWRGGPNGEIVRARWVGADGTPRGPRFRIGRFEAAYRRQLSTARLSKTEVAFAGITSRGFALVRVAEGDVQTVPLDSGLDSEAGDASPDPGGAFQSLILTEPPDGTGEGELWSVWKVGAGTDEPLRFVGRRIGLDGSVEDLPLTLLGRLLPASDPIFVRPPGAPVMGLWISWPGGTGEENRAVLARFDEATGLAYEEPLTLSDPARSASVPALATTGATTEGDAFATWIERDPESGRFTLAGRRISRATPAARPRSGEEVACAVEALRAALRRDETDTASADPGAGVFDPGAVAFDPGAVTIDPGARRCGVTTTSRDRALAGALAEMLVPEGRAARLHLGIARGRGIDRFRVEVVGRDDRGDVVAEGSFRVRVEIDAEGMPRALHLDALEPPLATSPGERTEQKQQAEQSEQAEEPAEIRPAGLAVELCAASGDCRVVGRVGLGSGGRASAVVGL